MIDPAEVLMGSHPEHATVKVAHRDLQNGVCVVLVEGEVDLATAPALKSGLAELLAQGLRKFVIELSGVRHLDSTGLGVLVGFRRRVPDDGEVTIAGARPNVLAVFELTGLDQSFDIFTSQDEALAHLQETGERQPALSPATAMTIGLVSTALPFADGRVAEAERWLRVLQMHGEAGRALTALGLSEAPLPDVAGPDAVAPAGEAPADAGDPIAAVTAHARRIAVERGAATVGTDDVLLGVMTVYGADFDWVLRTHGATRDDVIAHLGASPALIAA